MTFASSRWTGARSSRRTSVSGWGVARPLGGRDAGGRDDELQRQERVQGSSENMRLTERFTRLADDTIRYQFTVEDPATWTDPGPPRSL